MKLFEWKKSYVLAQNLPEKGMAVKIGKNGHCALVPYSFFVWNQWLYDFSTTGAIQIFCMAPVVVWFSKTINECNTLIRARGCMIFNHSCWPKRALRLGWYDFAYTRGFATRVAKSYHPARKALLDQQAWLKIIQPTRAH